MPERAALAAAGANGYAARVISVWEAFALTAVSFAALATFGANWAAHGLGGTVAAELLCVLLPALLLVALRRTPPATLGLVPARPPWLATLGGLVAGAGAFYLVAAGLEPWIERLWPTPAVVRDALQRLVIPASGARPLVVDLAALALVPALAEELLFRGILWGALERRLGTALTLVVTSVVFGLYHGSVYRFLPAMVGGLMLGGVRAWSRALWPAVAFHFANNAGVLVALHLGYDTPPPNAAPMVTALVASAAGAALLGAVSRTRSDRSR